MGKIYNPLIEQAIDARRLAVSIAVELLEPSIDNDADVVIAFSAKIADFILNGEQAPADDSVDTDTPDSAPEAPTPSVSAAATEPAPVFLPAPEAETPAPVAPVAIANAAETTPALTDPNPAPASAPIANDPAAQVPAAPTPATSDSPAS